MTTSRFVPGCGDTTVRQLPGQCVDRLLLPTLTTPAITMRQGSTRCRPSGRRALKHVKQSLGLGFPALSSRRPESRPGQPLTGS